MDYNFSRKESLFIYGRLRRELRELEALKDNKFIDTRKDIELYESILRKMEAIHPEYAVLSD